MLAAPCLEKLEIALRKAFAGLLILCIEGVHKTVAESIGIDIEGRMDEVWDIGPENLVAVIGGYAFAQRLCLYLQPDGVDFLAAQLALAARRVHSPLEAVEGDLPHHGVEHVLDLGGEE